MLLLVLMLMLMLVIESGFVTENPFFGEQRLDRVISDWRLANGKTQRVSKRGEKLKD